MTRHTPGFDKASSDGDCSAFWADKQTARLIQAAPDLLAACKALLRYCEGSEHNRDEWHAVDQARAAISKAEGRPLVLDEYHDLEKSNQIIDELTRDKAAEGGAA